MLCTTISFPQRFKVINITYATNIRLSGNISPKNLVSNIASISVRKEDKTLFLYRRDDELLKCSLSFYNHNSKYGHATCEVARTNQSCIRLLSGTHFATVTLLSSSRMIPVSLPPLSELSNAVPRLLFHRFASPALQTVFRSCAYRIGLLLLCLAGSVCLRWPGTLEGMIIGCGGRVL